MEQTVEAEMRRRDAPRISIGDISTSGGRLSFMVRDASQVDAARERINQLTTGAGMTGQRDWDIQVVRFEPLRPDPDKRRPRHRDQSGDGGRHRSRPPPRR